MKALLVSVTAGYGHHSTAKALSDMLEKKGVEVRTVDLLKYINKFLYDTVDKGYLFSTKHLPKQFGRVYRLLEKKDDMRKNHIAAISTSLMASKFKNFFSEFRPDVIISTHCFGAQVMDYLKRKGHIQCLLAGIVTDYTIHPFWRDLDNTEYLVTASDLLNHKILQKNLNLSKVLPFGIPIREKFLASVDRTEACRQLGLDPQKRTVLVVSGSMGHGNMENIIKEVDNTRLDLQIICVCGKNQKVFDRLKTIKTEKPLHLYGFVDNIDLMMDAAHCIITKPGGLTVTESLAKKLPLILVNPIPGHENYNCEFLVNAGVALAVSKHFSVGEAVYFLFNTPGRIEQIKESIEKISHPDAAERVADFLVNEIKK